MAAEVGKPKREPALNLPDPDIQKKVSDRVSGPMNELLEKPLTKNDFYSGMTAMKDEIVAELCTIPEGADAMGYPSLAAVREAFDQAEQDIVRERILSMGKRPDGRTPTEIRPIWCEVGLSPRAHGSGLFTRGETQVLSMATVPSEEVRRKMIVIWCVQNDRPITNPRAGMRRDSPSVYRHAPEPPSVTSPFNN